MDIVLKQILSLLPKNEDGSIKRGAKKNFAVSIGYDSGDIISMWINGTSKSYMKKLHQISAVHGVSIEYLMGEEQKEKPTNQNGGELSPLKQKALDLIQRMDNDTLEKFIKIGETISGDR